MNVQFMTRMVGSLLGQITFLSVVLEAVINCGAQYNPLIPNYCRFGLNRCYGGLLGGYGYPYGAGYGGQYNPYTIGSGLGLGTYGLGSSYNPYATGLGYGLGSNYGIYNPYSPLSTASTYTSGLYGGGLGNTMCVDRSTDCAYYASSGQCATTPYVMRNLCPISCGFGCDYTGGLGVGYGTGYGIMDTLDYSNYGLATNQYGLNGNGLGTGLGYGAGTGLYGAGLGYGLGTGYGLGYGTSGLYGAGLGYGVSPYANYLSPYNRGIYGGYPYGTYSALNNPIAYSTYGIYNPYNPYRTGIYPFTEKEKKPTSPQAQSRKQTLKEMLIQRYRDRNNNGKTNNF